MNRFFLSCVLFLNFTITPYAQLPTVYNGVVRDANTQEGISFATIAVFDKSILVDGVSTNEIGEFMLKVTQPHTHFQVSFIGYESYNTAVVNIQNRRNIVIHLSPSTDNLEEVVIRAEKTTTQLKIDRKVVNLGPDLQQQGTTALEAFDQIAEIQTDLSTGSITLRGAGNVRLLVNGKPSPLNATELLEQLSASSIDNIEIITSPSAKNQANGLSGIININMKKNVDQGFNLILNTSVGTKRYRYGFDTNYNFSKVNIRLNVAESKRNMDSKQWIEQRYTNGSTRDIFAPHDFHGNIRKLTSGVDFFLNEKNVLSFQFDHTRDFHSFDNNTFYTNVTNEADYVYVRHSSHTHKTTDYNVNHRKKFSSDDHFLEIDYNLTINKNVLPARDFEAGVFLFEELQINRNHLHALAIDYALPTKVINLETGLSWNFRTLNSAKDFVIKGMDSENDIFNYDEHLLGIYGIAKFATGKVHWQTGLRYEYFGSSSNNTTNDQVVNLNFSNLFPSLHLSYKFRQQHTVATGYSRRISRPNFRHINPFQIGNQYFQWNANPELAPEFSDNIELNYQYDAQHFNASLSTFFRHRRDVIQWIDRINDSGVRNVSFENLGTRNAYGVEGNFQCNVAKWWQSQLSANFYFTKANQPDITWDRLNSATIIFKNTIRISKTISTDITYRHTPKNQDVFSYTAPRNRIDWAIRAKFIANKLVTSLRVVDVLDQNLRHRTTILPNIVQRETWRFQTQTFGWLLSMSYKIFQNNEKTRDRKKRNYSHDGSVD